MAIDISIIIVNWNVKDMLADCLRSLEAYHGRYKIEIIVVDSASQDNSVTMLREQFPDVVTLAQSDNVGFVGGNNIGFEAAKGRYHFLLNPDTVVHPHAIATLIEYLEQHPNVGIVAPHTLNTDGTHQSTRRRFPTLFTGMIEASPWQQWLPDSLFNRFYMRDTGDESILEVDWAQGSALLARKDVYEQIGGLDPTFTMFSEEVDWCKRSKNGGWEIVYVGNAFITHHGGGSTVQVNNRKHIHFQQSKFRYFRKHHGWLAAQVVRASVIMGYLVDMGIEGAKLLLKHKPELRQDRIQAYRTIVKHLISGQDP